MCYHLSVQAIKVCNYYFFLNLKPINNATVLPVIQSHSCTAVMVFSRRYKKCKRYVFTTQFSTLILYSHNICQLLSYLHVGTEPRAVKFVSILTPQTRSKGLFINQSVQKCVRKVMGSISHNSSVSGALSMTH